MNLRSFFFIFFSTIISSSLALGSFEKSKVEPSPLEESIFDFEDCDGKIDKALINRFGHYDQYRNTEFSSGSPCQRGTFNNNNSALSDFYLEVINDEKKSTPNNQSAKNESFCNLQNLSFSNQPTGLLEIAPESDLASAIYSRIIPENAHKKIRRTSIGQ